MGPHEAFCDIYYTMQSPHRCFLGDRQSLIRNAIGWSKSLVWMSQKERGLLGHADLQMATRYVQDVSKQTDEVIEKSRMYVT